MGKGRGDRGKKEINSAQDKIYRSPINDSYKQLYALTVESLPDEQRTADRPAICLHFFNGGAIL